jgi:glycosyltransferase involved in cell wall biosynthesis
VSAATAANGTSDLPGKALVLVENLSVPLDRRVWQEATSLTKAGFRVFVVCPRGAKMDREPIEYLDGVTIFRYPLTPAAGGPSGYIREYGQAFWHTVRLVRRLAREHRFDVVQACNPPDFLLAAAWPLKRGGSAFIFDHHDLVPELYLSRFGRGKDVLYRTVLGVERLAFRLADVVMATNESYRHVALTRGRKDDADVFVVRSAPDLTRFRQCDPDVTLKRGKQHLISYLGVMGPQDGVDHALRALAAVREDRQDWHAIFMGGGDVLEAMRALSKELGVAEMVELPGRVPDDYVARVLSSSDVCLAPDPKNPLNDISTMNKILEYMAMSRPIVSYDLREARVSAGDAALYARPNDVASFAAAVERLLDDPALRERMGAAGRVRVENELSWQHSERALLSAYERALQLRRSQAP